MIDETKDSFFSQYGKCFPNPSAKMSTNYPFKNHAQFSTIVDILSRKHRHHALLSVAYPINIQFFFLEAFAQYLTEESLPAQLRNAELLYLDIENAAPPITKQKSIEDELEELRESLNKATSYKLFVISGTWLFAHEHKSTDDRFLRRQIKLLLAHPKSRFIVLTNSSTSANVYSHDERFAHLHINGLNNADVMAMLMQQRTELEDFHHILIPEELLTQAYALGERFLSTTNTLEHALLLLDSSAARISTLEPLDHQQTKPVLTSNVMLNVLSSWTHIPAAYLQMHKFKLQEFNQSIQQRVFGQDLAISIIGQELLQAQANLKQRSGPFCSFLFAGPAHCGKQTTALAMVEQLFKQPNILYFAQATHTETSLTELKVQNPINKCYQGLTEIIQQTPYAVVMFEEVEHASPAMLDGLQEIISTGYLHDATGQQYNFRQAIIILSTSRGAERLLSLTKPHEEDEDIYTMDLMQLIMSDQKQQKFNQDQHPSAQEIRNKLLPPIADCLPQSLYQHLQFIPFLPLNKEAAENIVRLKIKALGKQLEVRYGIEIGYAPEVIRYLAKEIVECQTPDHPTTNPEEILKQLYFCVEQATLSQADNKHRSNQLFLQLNETGNMLRCDWLTITARQHAT